MTAGLSTDFRFHGAGMSDGIEKRAAVSRQTQFHVRWVADSRPARRNNQFSNYV